MLRDRAPADTMSQRKAIGNLPAEVSSFIGRAGQLAQLVEVQRNTRLLTLVGAGGVGKTRLATRLAATLAWDYPDGVWFVELATVDEPAMLAKALASVLGVREQAGRTELQALTDALRNCYSLLIFDNCEHLVEACSDVAAALLRACPHIAVLATSRAPLEIDGETAWRVPPLSLPSTSSSNPVEVSASEAVQLFVARARARRPDFQLVPENSRAVAEICQRLDGLPLAVELVAARVGSMTEADLAAHIGEGLALQMSGRYRSAPRRQQTLRATLDWSYALLTDSERMLLRRLSIFAGGFALAAAQVVCADDDLPISSIADGLDRLASKSLVVVDGNSSTVRYQLLEMVRAYALERLRAEGEWELVGGWHLEYMLTLAERAAPEHMDADHARLLDYEYRNLRAALMFAMGSNQLQNGLRLATALCSLWYFRGRYAEGAEWLQRLLALPDSQHAPAHARAAAWLGQLLQLQGEFSGAARWLEVSVKLHRARKDKYGLALSTAMLAQLTLMHGDLKRARLVCAEAAERQRAIGAPGAINSRLQCAVIAIELGQVREARGAIAACEPRGRELPKSLKAWVLFMKGRVADMNGDSALAEGLLSQALQHMREIGEQQATLVTLIELGHVRIDRQSVAAGMPLLIEAFELAHLSGDRVLLARALEGLGRCAAAEQPMLAARLAAAADGLRYALNTRPWPSEKRRLESWLPKVRLALKPSAFESTWQAGRLASSDAVRRLVTELRNEPKIEQVSLKDPLTRREREVVQLLARALTNQQIAAELTISPATARTHVDHVLAKLGLHTRGQVALWASQRWQRSKTSGSKAQRA
jgi:predicted ATPase/DNA-binding CsgD family transcriptional regulator